MRGKFLLPIFLLFLIPVVQSQTCGNNLCEYNIYEFTNGALKTIPISPTQAATVSMAYNSTDSIILNVNGFPITLSRGSVSSVPNSSGLQTINIRVEDIDDTAKTAKLAFGENSISCRSDCFLTHRLRVSQTQLPSYNSKIDCSSNTCFLTWQDGTMIYGSVYGNTPSQPQQYLLSTNVPGINLESKVKEGGSKALIVWRNSFFHPNLRRPFNDIYGVLFDANGPIQSAPIAISNSTSSPFFKSLGSLAFDSISNYWLVAWTDARPLEWQFSNGTKSIRYDQQIMGAFVNTQGSVGSDGNIGNQETVHSFNPNLFFDRASGQYILSWYSPGQQGNDIKVTILNKNGIALLQNFVYQQQADQANPVVKKGNPHPLLVFDDLVSAIPSVFGQFLGIRYNPTGPLVPVNISFSKDQIISEPGFGPDLFFNSKSNEFVQAWSLSDRIILKRMDLTGAELSRTTIEGYSRPSIGYLESADKYVIAVDRIDRLPSQIYLIFLDKNLKEVSISSQPTPAVGRYTAPKDAATKTFSATDIAANRPVVDGENLTTNTVLVFKNPSNQPKLKVGIKPAQGPVNLSNVVIESSDTATVVRGLSGLANVETTHSLFLQNANNGLGLFVCPTATTLPEVVQTCANKVEFTSIPSVNGTLSVNFTDSTNSTYLVDGLQGTGIGLIQSTQNITSLNVSIDGSKVVGEPLNFRANYTKNSVPISNASCTILFSTAPNGPFNMTASNSTYVFNRTFADAGTYQATVECSKANETTKNQIESFTILAGVAKAPVVLLQSPQNNFNSPNNSITFTCFASDTENIKAIDLFANTDGAWGFKNTQTTQPVKNFTATFTLDNVPNGQYQWNCRAANDKNALGFAPANFTFSVNAPTIPDCKTTDWVCNSEWFPADASCEPGTTQTRACPPPTNCKNSDAVKPTDIDTKICSNVACIATDYQCLAWSECSDKGQQTRSCSLKSGLTCFGSPSKTESQTCTPPGNPFLLIGIVIIIVLGVVGAFFYFHRKAKTADEEETLYQEENTDESGEPSYDQGEYPPEEGGDAGEEEK